MRYALPGRGKSGGVRIIHCYKALDDMVFLLDIYIKKQKENLTSGPNLKFVTFIRKL